MLQEVKHGLQPLGARNLPEYERDTSNKKTSHKFSVLETFSPLTIYNRAGPKFPEDTFFVSPPENILKLNVCLIKYFVWLFCRCLPSNGDQRPSIGRYISSTGSVLKMKTTIDYCKTIHQPVTQFETVQELLQQLEEATETVIPKNMINTFSLGVRMKALQLIWTFPDKFKEHVLIFSYRNELHWDVH